MFQVSDQEKLQFCGFSYILWFEPAILHKKLHAKVPYDRAPGNVFSYMRG